mgnify:CR=1 FL=1
MCDRHPRHPPLAAGCPSPRTSLCAPARATKATPSRLYQLHPASLPHVLCSSTRKHPCSEGRMEGCQQPVQAHNKGDVTTNPLNTHAASVLSTIPRGIMARILACHASDPGSIPGAGVFFVAFVLFSFRFACDTPSCCCEVRLSAERANSHWGLFPPPSSTSSADACEQCSAIASPRL